MRILGLHIGHNASAALVEDGVVKAAVAEERIVRDKDYRGFPCQSTREVLSICGLGLGQVDKVVVSSTNHYLNDQNIESLKGCLGLRGEKEPQASDKDARPQLGAGAKELYFYLLGILFGKWGGRFHFKLNRHLRKKTFFKLIRAYGIDPGKLEFVNHHLAHAASAYFCSGWPSCTIITMDAGGDGYGATVNIGRDGRVKMLYGTEEFNPGYLYYLITEYLGFKPARHEGKVVGLAAYGNPDALYKYFVDLFSLSDDKRKFITKIDKADIGLNWLQRKKISAVIGDWYLYFQGIKHQMQKRLQGAKSEDIASAVQKRLEDVVVEHVREAVAQTKERKVVLAGGLFANVKLNQRILELPQVENIYIHPDMGDGGLSVGAALAVWSLHLQKETTQDPTAIFLKDVYLGPEFSDQQIEAALKEDQDGLVYQYIENIEEAIARLLAEKKVVGRFNGRMEYGPRALGNRSILVDPTDKSVNDWLNKRLRRTEFMPFAPSILEEAAGEYFVGWQSGHIAARFMTITYDVDKAKAKTIDAAVHIDNTARPQVVRRQDNPSFYKIIKEYQRHTGLPVVINTSFNMHEEPIVRSPQDAIRAFKSGAVDVLAMGHWLVSKKDG